MPMSLLYWNDTGMSLRTSSRPDDASSEAILFLKRWLDVMHDVPALATTSLLAVRQSTLESALSEVSPANPTVPFTENVRQGVVVPIPMLPVERLVVSPLMPVPKIRLPMSRWFEPFVEGSAMSYPMAMLLLPPTVVEAARGRRYCYSR